MAGIESRLYRAELNESSFSPHRLAMDMMVIVHIYNINNHDNSMDLIGYS